MLGSTGTPVRELQSKLQGEGYEPGAIDGWFGPLTQRAVLAFQAAKALRDDGLIGAVTAERLGLKVAFEAPDPDRERAPLLLLANPNYFGNLPASSYQPVKVIKGNVDYEELVCIGYNPDVRLLQAIIHLKKESGYRTTICGTGSVEYVRFYVDWDNDGNWEDVGVATLDAHDVPGRKPLEYGPAVAAGRRRSPCPLRGPEAPDGARHPVLGPRAGPGGAGLGADLGQPPGRAHPARTAAAAEEGGAGPVRRDPVRYGTGDCRRA
jgi:peptidoglycan hydrolase-like protein with peptidoglycan-binding domain